MKLDRFLAKLFSRTTAIVMLVTLLLLTPVLSSCVCTEADCLLCIFCGCITPDTACTICGNTCDFTQNCACDCFSSCSDQVQSGGNPSNPTSVGCDCVKDCMTDEEGNPIDCEDVGCPECQKYFECE